MIDISKFSNKYIVKRLNKSNIDEIYEICKGNELFYNYGDEKLSREQIIYDMTVTPPGVDKSNKYYVGFYKDNELVAILDVVEGYPKDNIAYIGYFMMNKEYQGRQIGSSIIYDVEEYLKSIGIKSVRVAIYKDNPQATTFWKKNGYETIRELDKNNWAVIESEHML